MKKIKYEIGLFLTAVVLIGLFMFSNSRNNKRKIKNTKVEFIGEQRLFLDEDFVDKLLIQNIKKDSIRTKEALVLKEKELLIKKQPHVDNAEVYVSVNGEISVRVKQKVPVARLYGSASGYIDAKGSLMPLSKNNSVRVPLVYYFTESHKNDLLKLLKKIEVDNFLKKLVVRIDCAKNNQFNLRLRDHNFLVNIGNVEELDLKTENLKAFYAKVQKDTLFKKYAKINLGIANQVVCTKI